MNHLIQTCLFLFYFSLTPAFSQLIDARGRTGEEYESFHARFISEQNIRSIHIDISDKPDNEIIRDKGLVQHYEFNRMGMLTRSYFTIVGPTPAKNGKISYDTLFTFYEYDTNGRLIIKRTRSGDSYNSWYYSYGNEGEIHNRKNVRESNVLAYGGFHPGMQTLIAKDSLDYKKLSATQRKIRYLNDENRVYKECLQQKDEQGRLIREEEEFTITWFRNSHSYEYAPNGSLFKTKFLSNIGGDSEQEESYEYDEKGNLTMIRQVDHGIKTNEISFLFDEKQLVRSSLDRDFIRHTIGIRKYTYSFY